MAFHRSQQDVGAPFHNKVINGGNLDLIDELVAEDFVEHQTLPGLKGIGSAGSPSKRRLSAPPQANSRTRRHVSNESFTSCRWRFRPGAVSKPLASGP